MAQSSQESIKGQSSPIKISVLTKLALIPIKFYQYVISPALVPSCRFEPSCSRYAEEAIKQHGIFLGSYYTIKRLAKCHPWHSGGIDPVPGKTKH